MVARAVSRTGSVGRFAPPPKRDLALTAPVQTADVLNKAKSEVTADSLIAKIAAAFGEIGQSEKAKAVVIAEVNNYLRLGRKDVSEEDVSALKSRICSVLQGGGPTRSTKVAYKRAVADADEWSRLYAFIDSEHLQKDKASKEVDAVKRKQVQDFQKVQVAEVDSKHNREHAEELAYARQLEADVKKWREEEAEKIAKHLAATHRLKASVEEQLVERREQKQMEAALKLQEERYSAADMAAELKAKIEAEAAAVAKAKDELKVLLSANEVNKAIKEQHRLEEQALDRKYARQYAEKLDNEEKARLAQLAKRAEYQNRQAAIAQDLPESKRWINPEIIERNFRAKEEADEARDKERMQKTQAAQNQFRSELADQVKGRQQEAEKLQAKLAAEDIAMEASFKAEVAKGEAEKLAVAARKEALRVQRAEQLQDAIARKLAVEEAMTKTEKEINADILRRMHAAEPHTRATAFVV